MSYLLGFIAIVVLIYLAAWITVAAVMWLVIPALLIVLPVGLFGGVLLGCTIPVLTLTGYRQRRPRTITAQDVKQGTSNLPKVRGEGPFGRDPAWPSYLFAQSRVDLREIWRRTVGTLDAGWRRCWGIGDQWDHPVGWTVVIGLCSVWLMVSIGALAAVGAVLLACGSVLLVVTAGWLLVAGVVRGGDSLVRRVRRASGSCQSCFYVFSLPAFPCARCGEIHRDVRPGMLGALWRRCLCGAVLPTTVLRAAYRLQTSCPNCLAPLRAGAAVHREIRLPVFGPVSAGKTRLVYAGLLALRDQAAATGASVEFADEQSRRAFEYGVEIIRTGADTPKTPAGHLPIAITAQVTIGAQRKALLHFFDAAGEFYIDRGDNSELLFLDHAQGLVFVVDPFSIPWVRDQLGGLSQVMLARANAALDDPEQVYHVTAGRLRDYGVRMSHQRLAIAVVKADLLVNLPLARDLRPHQVREWLQDAGLDNLVLAAERDFAEVRYFVVASVHGAPAGSLMSPANPFAWLITRAGLQLLPGEFDLAKQPEEAT